MVGSGSSRSVPPLKFQINHKRNKIPTDGKLVDCEEQSQPLLGLLAQLHRGNGLGGTVGSGWVLKPPL